MEEAEFRFFPSLPKELRLSIWQLALEPRIVELCFTFKDDKDGKQGDDGIESAGVKGDSGSKDMENKDDDQDRPQEVAGITPISQSTKDTSVEAEGQKNDEANDNDPDTSETPSLQSQPFTKGQFYSPSPLPALLGVNSEARFVARAGALENFPLESNKEDVYYNPEIDILYFPAWCWHHDIEGFEQLVNDEVKGRIRKIALENLMWMSYWDEGGVNGQITIERFKGVKEFIFATREITQCGCCIDFDGPERGLPSFVEIETEPDYTIEEADETNAETEAESSTLNEYPQSAQVRQEGVLEFHGEMRPRERGAKTGKKGGRFDYTKEYISRLEEEFVKINEADPEWNIPKPRFVHLMRGGELAGDP